jgi:lysozyme
MLKAVEEHYKVKPIIYTGKGIMMILKEEFSDYLLIAIILPGKYAGRLFWQFTEKQVSQE